MTLKQIFSIALMISTSAMHAADTSNDDISPAVFTFYTNQLEGANDKRIAPRIEHRIDPSDRETLTGETFHELFKTNACEKNIPWLLGTVLIKSLTENPIIDYCDIVGLLKKQNRVYQSNDFASHETTAKIIHEAIETENYLKHYQPSLRPPLGGCHHSSCLYYATKNSMHFENVDQPIIEFTKEGCDKISDLSCTLAIALCNDYSQLLRIIGTFLSHEARLSHYDKQKKDFWCKTFLALPDEKQKSLLKECKERFGWELSISKKQLNS